MSMLRVNVTNGKRPPLPKKKKRRSHKNCLRGHFGTKSQQHSDPMPYRGQSSLAEPSQSSPASMGEEDRGRRVPKPRIRETLAAVGVPLPLKQTKVLAGSAR